MSNMYKNEKGIAGLVAMLLVALIVAVIFVGLYKVINPGRDLPDYFSFSKPEVEQTVTEISDSTDTDVIEAELEATDLGDFEDDFAELEEDLEELE